MPAIVDIRPNEFTFKPQNKNNIHTYILLPHSLFGQHVDGKVSVKELLRHSHNIVHRFALEVRIPICSPSPNTQALCQIEFQNLNHIHIQLYVYTYIYILHKYLHISLIYIHI